METILLIAMGVCLVGIFYCMYLLERNDRVLKFRLHVLHNMSTKDHENMPSYSAMVYSFKALTVENWIK